MARPVVVQKSLGYQPVSEGELDIGVAYAKTEYEKDLDRDLLRLVVNTTLERRNAQTKLAFLAATVVRENIRLSNKEQAPKIDAYKGAIMKVMSTRRVRQMQRDAEKRKQGLSIPMRPKQVEHPLDPRPQFADQYRLIS